MDTGLPKSLGLKSHTSTPSFLGKEPQSRVQADPPEFIHFQWYWARWNLGGI